MAVDVEYRDLLDDYEAGEIAVDLDDKDPQEVIAWSIERFQRQHLAICTSFQSDWMALRPSNSHTKSYCGSRARFLIALATYAGDPGTVENSESRSVVICRR